ncbi:hypothetical protein PF010_g6723 [Phytophthora fragariae]|uniref:CCHC-type domain-containing protein n=1 Tax=Phytophthora fragariae TaxID=53985 RepID=A0A6G0LKJ9_9STRA|nr:hypothetical protein PF010_g6723 [Phytophthora fragariae]KAE9242933.1 hypothetical protein PF004_g6386 [Phytophthora fragariae]
MFEAVVAAIKGTQGSSPRNEWLLTIAELYAISHKSVKIDEDRVPAGKTKYPKLRGDERALLHSLFREKCVVDGASFAAWESCVVKVTQDLYNTTWSFKNIVQSLIGKVQWARVQPLNQWAEKVKAGNAAASGPREGQGRYQNYMFNPVVYTPKDIEELRTMCAQPVGDLRGRQLREGTKEEWRIIAGIADGTIVCRRMPDFLKSILDAKELIRFYRTIQRQVEGELVVQLHSGVHIHESRQQTREIKDDILAAAVEAKVNVPELQRMLHLAKTISYNHATRSIHIFFFDRKTAGKYQGWQLPFKRAVYRLVNVHRPDSGSVWARQLGRDGVRLTDSRKYQIDIYNITRFTDVGRLTAYLQLHLGVDYEFEDMDECTPNSRTSTVWRLTIKSAECPQFLRGIVRLVWFGRTLVLKHPYARQRLQCLRCGNLGHTMSRCRYTPELLQGVGSRVATDAEVAKLEDLAQPFASLAELKQSAAQRLKVQADVERKAMDAVKPEVEEQVGKPSPTRAAATASARAETTNGQDNATTMRVAPEPKAQWVAVPKARGRTLYAHPAALQQKGLETSTRFAVLAEEADGNDVEEEPDSKPQARPIIEISSGDEEETKPKPTLSEQAKEQLHLLKKKPPKSHDVPQLVALKQRERKVLDEQVGQLAGPKGPKLVGGNLGVEKITTFSEIEMQLGLRPVTTPSSGNCMAMAIAQAVADHSLAAFDTQLEKITGSIKSGIKWTAHQRSIRPFHANVNTDEH